MKKLCLICFVLFSLLLNIQAQGGASAEVFFTIKYEGMEPDKILALPKNVSFLVSGNNTKQIIKSTEDTLSIISNGDSTTLVNLTNIGNEKVGVIFYAEDIKVSKSKIKISVKETKTQIKILGYMCTKYIVTVHNTETKEKTKDIVYATDKIGGEKVNFLLYEGVKGFILSSEKTTGKEVVTMIAKRIVKKEIPAEEFLVPKDYVLTTANDQIIQDN